MRKAGIIIGVLVLSCAFAAAWVLLTPGRADAPATGELLACGPAHGDLAPLDTRTREEGENNLPLASRQDADQGATSDPAGGTTSRPQGTVEAQRPTVAGGTPTSTGEGPVSQTGNKGEAPAPGAGEAPALPFIKGHRRPPGQNLGNTRPEARKLAKSIGVKALSDVTPKLMQDRRGLYAQYFRLQDSDVSKLDTSSPDMVRIDRQVYFADAEAFSDLPINLDNFAAVWEGFLLVPEQGDYWLFWGADNGGRVELDGETVLLQDGMVRYVEVSAVLTLQPGLHPLRIEFAQTHNQVADWAKCAANFMWVPEGQTKPVPVPPEMLMVPEWMWSDNAPIITSLSRYKGEIGDEITIHGQALYTKTKVPALGGSVLNAGAEFADQTRVFFAGQGAAILEQSDSELRVRVPIGAKSGDVMVTKAKPAGWTGNMSSLQPAGWGPAVPSNSVDFTVTTQFGLMAEWYDLSGWDNFGFEVFDGTTLPDQRYTRIEIKPGREPAPEGIETFAARWTGKLGVPIASEVPIPESGPFPSDIEYTFSSNLPLRVTASDALVISSGWDGIDWVYRVIPDVDGPRFLTVVVEAVSSPSTALKWSAYCYYCDSVVHIDGKNAPVMRNLYEHFLFPPVVPPKPPEIQNVAAVAEGAAPLALPYDVDSSRPSISVGQGFTFELFDFGPDELWQAGAAPISVTIDGVPLAYTVDSQTFNKPADSGRRQQCRAVMPAGVGEGRMVARLSVVTSEPVFIDIANRGLVAYLYDFPDGSGLGKLPDLGPLTCFKVRKDRVINFESAADFDLPFPAETFVIEWLGGLIIEEEGDYTFTCRSDDGMKLWLDDNVVLDADKLQAPAENSATVHLVPGTYRFRMQFFENNQHEVCVLEWAATRGEGSALETIIPRAVIPARAFTLDVHPPFPNKTSTGKRTDGS